MQDIQTILEAVAKVGLGAASFVALCYFGWRMLTWMQKIQENHLTHIQEGMESLNQKSDKTNELLQKLVEK